LKITIDMDIRSKLPIGVSAFFLVVVSITNIFAFITIFMHANTMMYGGTTFDVVKSLAYVLYILGILIVNVTIIGIYTFMLNYKLYRYENDDDFEED